MNYVKLVSIKALFVKPALKICFYKKIKLKKKKKNFFNFNLKKNYLNSATINAWMGTMEDKADACSVIFLAKLALDRGIIIVIHVMKDIIYWTKM
jgi:hypothetical protein